MLGAIKDWHEGLVVSFNFKLAPENIVYEVLASQVVASGSFSICAYRFSVSESEREAYATSFHALLAR